MYALLVFLLCFFCFVIWSFLHCFDLLCSGLFSKTADLFFLASLFQTSAYLGAGSSCFVWGSSRALNIDYFEAVSGVGVHRVLLFDLAARAMKIFQCFMSDRSFHGPSWKWWVGWTKRLTFALKVNILGWWVGLRFWVGCRVGEVDTDLRPPPPPKRLSVPPYPWQWPSLGRGTIPNILVSLLTTCAGYNC